MRKIDIFTHIYPRPFFDKLMTIASDYKDVGKRSRGVPIGKRDYMGRMRIKR